MAKVAGSGVLQDAARHMKDLRAVGREKQEYNSFCFLSISSSSVSPVTRTGVGISSIEIQNKKT